MALKKGRTKKPIESVRKVAKGVQAPAVADNQNKQKQRLTLHASEGNVIQETKLGGTTRRKTKDFTMIQLSGSKGQSYTVAVPSSYVDAVPFVWEWTTERYRVAELLAEGIPLAQIPNYPEINLKSRMTIYGWLEHPEFKQHVDALVLETGWANRRERLSKLARLNEIMFTKVINEIDSVRMSDKMAGAILNAIQAGAKLLAQEKGEFVEESKVSQDTTITGTVATVTAKLDDIMASKSAEDRKLLESEFDKVGDDLIRHLTGTK